MHKDFGFAKDVVEVSFTVFSKIFWESFRLELTFVSSAWQWRIKLILKL